MGTRIDGAATAHGRHGALRLSDDAARACLARGGHRAGDLDILINAGMYKDRNIAEPALAAIIQDDLGANRGHPPRLGHHGTFSFDIQNGGCGVITAAQLVDTFVGPGAARVGMIVAGDADPSPRTSRGFRFAPAGGALVVSHTDDATGFTRFTQRTFPEHQALFEANVRWDPDAGFLGRGKNVLEMIEAPELAEACVEHAADVTSALLGEADLRASDVDLLITSQCPLRFPERLARRLGVPLTHLPQVAPELGTLHTAGPIAALEAAIEGGRFAAAATTLFVTVGAGITVAAALYRASDISSTR